MSKVVFVGNVPYNMTEDELVPHFREVGQVVALRLVFDRDTGKPKGYGFCEYADHETALSAVRNLNNTDVGGRSLRIDLADSDPFLEGKTTVRGELTEAGGGERNGKRDEFDVFLSSLPAGTPIPLGKSATDHITHTLAQMTTARSMDVLAQMKAFVITHPEHARKLLTHNPQLAYALFQSLFLNRVTDQSVLTRMLDSTGAAAAAAQPVQHAPPPSSYSMYGHQPPQPQQNMYKQQPSRASMPPPSQAQSSYYRQGPTPVPTPPQPPSQAPPIANVSEDQKVLLRQVLSMPDDKIAELPENERAAILQLRQQFRGVVL
ncbi:hypothetical protein CYLTODRAFT_422949 [Cylindrobasidium torrendii FP15055 ss-10]|uniref:RRM domain-containing protein n=1 Tax=Cylindrobasidium torrendii FP15055 ss-10 TaxID=1314674 RepID=A0A0D7B9L7_9AGAR|nr:hypothetical protein CYLTODRAFT_422949 [Cylindrobasidium torrendii FP15055 ss-10]